MIVCLGAAAFFLDREVTTPLATPNSTAQTLSNGKLPIGLPDSENESVSKTLRGIKKGTRENKNQRWLDSLNFEANRRTETGSGRYRVSEPKETPSKATDYANRRTKSNSEENAVGLSIAGRVSSELGEGISGIRVFASAQRLFSNDRAEDLPKDRSKDQTLTGDDGFYEFRELQAGDYEIHTAPTEHLPGARLLVRAGTQSADIRLQEIRILRLFGRVADTEGNAVAGALVQPINQDSFAATDTSGNYTFEISIGQQGENYVFDVSMPGYNEKRFGIREAEVRNLDEIRFDVQLEPLGATAAVDGRVTDGEGKPLKEATIRLYSPNSKLSFQAVSEPDGSFSLPTVSVGDDYQLWVHAGEEFSDYVEQPLNIPTEGLDLTVMLDSLETASLSGRMVDARGAPIPWLGLWLRSSDTAATLGMIIGDQDGRFHIEDLPKGELSAQTRTPPYLSVNGINLTAAEADSVELILDWGNLEIQGKIIDELGQPIPEAEISASWSFQDGLQRSKSSRRTTSGIDGGFKFTGLGPGVHAIGIQATGYQSAWTELDPQTDERHLLIALEKLPEASSF